MSKKYGDFTLDTWAVVNGEEMDVVVHYYTSPAEPDVNWPGSVDITGVYSGDEDDLVDFMTPDEVESLLRRVEEYESDRLNPDNDPRY